MADKPFKNLKDWLRTPNCFPDRFLTQSCPLLESAREAQRAGLQSQLVQLLSGDPWQRYVTECGEDWRKGTEAEQHQHAVVLEARRNLVLAAMGHDVPDNLRRAIEGYQRAIGHEFVPQLQDVCQSADRFRSTAIQRRLNAAGNSTAQVFEQLAGEFGGWNPALLATAAGYADIFSPASKPDHQVRTHLLFALGKQDGGLIARLTLKRFDFDADAGGGVCYPDPVSMGYIKSHACFQQALQQAWWREILPHLATCNFDICWSLQLIGDHGRPNDDGSGNADANLRRLRTDLMLPLSGPSAGMAFACAFRALRLKEQLDPHMAITADFAAHFDSSNTRSLPVSVLDKLRAEQERAGIDEVLTSSDHTYFTDSGIQPDENGVRISPAPQRGRLKLIGLPDLDEFYKRASRHARVAAMLKAALEVRAADILANVGGRYTRSPLSRELNLATTNEVTAAQGSKDEQVKHLVEKSRIGVPPDELTKILSGQPLLDRPHHNRLLFLADSGFGKSTMLVEVERRIAASTDATVPIRVGAGLASRTRVLPLLSEIPWQINGDTELQHLGRWCYNHLWKPLRIEGLTEDDAVSWFCRAVSQGDVVLLLDSTDQTSGDLADLALFLQSQPECLALLSGRPDTLEPKKRFYASEEWHYYWVEPFGEDEVESFCQNEEIARRLWRNTDWRALVTVPVLLKEMLPLALEGRLDDKDVCNREAVYALALERLVEHGRVRSQNADQFTRHLARAKKLHRQAAWATIRQESQGTGSFTGRLFGDDAVRFQEKFEKKYKTTESMESLGILTMAYLEDVRDSETGLAWRHFSFCEWFAGLHLASLSPEKQAACLQAHALDERWSWIFRFALSAAARQHDGAAVKHLATCLLSAGAPFLLWKCIDSDHISVDDELETLCRWLVHRDRESWRESWDSNTSPWADKEASDRPTLDATAGAILKSMFAIDSPEPWRRRDSRWLHPAWQLVIENLPRNKNAVSDVQAVCQQIHDAFLSEFETRVRAAAGRNQHRFRKHWRYEDQGLLQLVPDDVLLELGVLPDMFNDAATVEVLRHWPNAGHGTYEQRRDRFNAQLKVLGANYCLCPPVDWEHPYQNADGTARDPHECHVRGTKLRRQADESWINNQELPHLLPAGYELQRTPVTNLQFEAFDSNHRRWRQMQWFRREMESEDRALDNHPVVEVSPYQADMLAIWMTGRGTFGTFRLPFEEDWEAAARAGRDAKSDEFGIPWCDDDQQPILDDNGKEQFDSLSSHGANFDGRHPHGRAKKGPDLNGTVPVDRYPANGLGIADMHGQTWEWMENDHSGEDRSLKATIGARDNRCVRGGSWYNYGWNCRSSLRFIYDIRYYLTGFRVSRTK